MRIAYAEQSSNSLVAESALRCLLLGLWEPWYTFLLWCMLKHLLIKIYMEPIFLVSSQEVI